MSVYLATNARNSGLWDEGELETTTYCSAKCRTYDGKSLTWCLLRYDNSYEFDEVCNNCGVLIPASA
jgi:hypothetical protein